MAAKNPPQSLAKGVDKELTCAICISRLVEPKVLPCLHTYCKGCLVSLVEKGRDKENVTCPQCQETHQIPANGVDGFRSHFMVTSLLELLHVHDNMSGVEVLVISCESGVDENPAVARCLTCEDYLCESCFALHKKQKVTRDHTVLSLEEIKGSAKKKGVKSLRKKRYCDEHKDEVLKLFCKTCKVVICRDCTLVKHRDHDYSFIHEVRQDTQKKLEELIETVQAREVETQAHIDHLGKIQKCDVESLHDKEKQINATFDELLAAVNARREELLLKLQETYKVAEKQIEVETDATTLTLMRLSDSVQFTRQLLDNGDDVEVMSMSPQAEQTLESLAKTTWEKDGIKPTSLNIFDVSKKLINSIRSCGVVGDLEIVVEDLPKLIQSLDKFTFKIKVANSDGFTTDFVIKITYDDKEIPVEIKNNIDDITMTACIPLASYQQNPEQQLGLTIAPVGSPDTILHKQTVTVKVNPPIMRVGAKVIRGPDWSYKDQDGRKGCIGEVTGMPSLFQPGWVDVRWESGGGNQYRWGVQNKFDLKVIG